MVGRIAIIGGTGIGEALSAFGTGVTHDIDTPFGRPSAPIVTIDQGGLQLALLQRHGEGHLLNPSRVPSRANIFALKKLGVTHVIATGAVGSLKEEFAPRHLVLPDQVVDRTIHREPTFYEDLAVHIEFSDPFCSTLRAALLAAAPQVDTTVHPTGTYVCMEGPAFSTRAESHWNRQLGGHLIGMTLMPEARHAREAALCYAAVTLPTDYDSWRPHGAGNPLQVMDAVIANLKAVTAHGLSLVRHALPLIATTPSTCRCQSALDLAVWSNKSLLSPAVRAKYLPLLGKHLD